MSGRPQTGQPQRRRSCQQPGSSLGRRAVAVAMALGVLGIGIVLGFGDFLDRPTSSSSSGMPVRLSMAGFDPPVIPARAGELLTLELWTTDAAAHLQGGVHTLISDELGFYEQLPAESRRTVTLQMPSTVGDYDVYCDTCCGGKRSPTMHAILRVET